MSRDEPTIEDFRRALPEGWAVERTIKSLHDGRPGHVITAAHRLYGRVSIGPKLRVVALDVQLLADRVRDAEAPPMTYSQWQAAGIRAGYLRATIDEPLPRALRLLAICIEREDVEASDVVQALLGKDTYTIDCPVAAASNYGSDVYELGTLLARVAAQYGVPLHGHARESEDT